MTDQSRIISWIQSILEEAARLSDDEGIELLHACGGDCAKPSALLEGASQVRKAHHPSVSDDALFADFKSRYYETPRLRKDSTLLKTTKLFYPEWQGYGEDRRAHRGAYTMLSAFSNPSAFAVIEVAANERLALEGGVLGRAAIENNTRAGLALLHHEKPERIFMIGGTCGAEMVPVAYLNHRYCGDLAVLWLDAHGDLNTPESSPSGHFHGMVLRTLLGDGDGRLTKIVPLPLKPAQVTLVGARDLDAPESEYLTAQHISVIAPHDVVQSETVDVALERSGSSHLYIHLDLDALDPEEFGGAMVPSPGGITMETMQNFLADLNRRYSVVGLSVVEYAAKDSSMASRIADLLDNSGLSWATNRLVE